jgi:hypothetical protein
MLGKKAIFGSGGGFIGVVVPILSGFKGYVAAVTKHK